MLYNRAMEEKVTLSGSGEEVYMSRSEADRVLGGLEKFRKVELDFKGIRLIGQGFADEIFRVWQNQHPEVVLTAVNMNPTVEMMVNHARNTAVE